VYTTIASAAAPVPSLEKYRSNGVMDPSQESG
jgi:hypothetical protein